MPHFLKYVPVPALLVWALCSCFLPVQVQALVVTAQSGGGPLSLGQCLTYALNNQPVIRQAHIDEESNEASIRISLSGWLPQVGLTATGQHYFGLPYTVLPNADGVSVPRQIGLRNTSGLNLSGLSREEHLAGGQTVYIFGLG